MDIFPHSPLMRSIAPTLAKAMGALLPDAELAAVK